MTITDEPYRLNGINNDNCPTRIMLSAVEGKWKMLLVYHLLNSDKRAGEFERLIPEAKRQMLFQHLKELERDGLVKRTAYPEIPPKVVYSLTEMGKTLEPIFELMYGWGLINAPQIQQLRGKTVGIAALV